jgi:hypothetical protein
MTETKQLLERAWRQFPPTPDVMDALIRRRDRKRRNQRIAAGVVGIAVFVAAIWVVTSVASLDRSETSVVPGGDVTGPAATGPADGAPYDYDSDADYAGLPPQGAEPSSPERSELIAEAHAIHVGWVYVFEDGRVISFSLVTLRAPDPMGYREQRLTAEGVELVRSGVIDPAAFICYGDAVGYEDCQGQRYEIPATAWEDSTLRPYVPYRYAICDSRPLRKFPEAAQDLLLGKEATFEARYGDHVEYPECFDLTTEEARALDEVLDDAGFYIQGPGAWERWWGGTRDTLPELSAAFVPILPHGTFGVQGGG